LKTRGKYELNKAHEMAFASAEDYYRSEGKFFAKFIEVLWATKNIFGKLL